MMNAAQINEFETLQGQLEAFYQEMNTLVKKSANDSLNKFKLGLLNSILRNANTHLGKERLPFDDFSQFEDEQIPSISDVLVILSQYLASFEKLRSENIYYDTYGHGWVWNGAENIRTSPPKKIGK